VLLQKIARMLWDWKVLIQGGGSWGTDGLGRRIGKKCAAASADLGRRSKSPWISV
jgi:hypothetical protein